MLIIHTKNIVCILCPSLSECDARTKQIIKIKKNVDTKRVRDVVDFCCKLYKNKILICRIYIIQYRIPHLLLAHSVKALSLSRSRFVTYAYA